MAKKKQTMEELLEEALVPEEEQPYEIGSSWIWVKLGDVANIKRGASPRPKGDPKYFGGDIPWLKISDISSQGRYVYTTQDTVTDAGKEKSVWVEPNTIILSISASVGKACINKVGVCIHDGFVQIKENETLIDKLYLYHYLISALNRILSKAKGAAQVNINSAVVKELAIPLPPLNEQKRIADKVERLLDKIDEAKQLIEEAKESFELRRAAILDKAFRGELTREWREDNINDVDLFDFLIEYDKKRRNCASKGLKRPEYLKYNANEVLKKSKDIHNGWVEAPVGFLCDSIVPGRTKPKSFTGEIPWVTIPDIVGNEINVTEIEFKLSANEVREVNSKIIPIDSVIMSCIGRFGISAVVDTPIVINQQLHAFLPSEIILPKYLMYYITVSKDYFNSIATSTTVAYLNKTNANSLPVHLPSINEQKVIVEKIEEMFSLELVSLDLIIDINKRLQLIKQSILSKAFKGELGTNDPTEENAIERLKEVLQEKQ